jgi:hypothetical protein
VRLAEIHAASGVLERHIVGHQIHELAIERLVEVVTVDALQVADLGVGLEALQTALGGREILLERGDPVGVRGRLR